jgi:serine protease AprX
LKRIAAAMCASLLLMSGTASAPGATADAAQRFVSMIVQGVSPQALTDAIASVGGRVTQPLPIVNGVSADVPASSASTLRSMPGVLNVTPNDPIEFQGGADGQRVQKVVGANKLWDSGITGRGVTVAILDTGIYAGHPDLAGRVIHCEDLTSERLTDANCADSFGHGTFMAGLVAGNGASSGGQYRGTAPGANLVAIKAAGYDGSTDVSKILAGIQWAVLNKDAYNIRVLNLSLGSDSSQDYRLSPLNFAVERAWLAGIVVVASTGNTGPSGGTVMKPGDDPYIITVGSSSDMGTTSTGDDVVTGFSGRGPTRSNGLAKPDVVSPGMHTISLRSPGSTIDSHYPTARVDNGYFRGSGTSMSTATVSGVVAQMLQANPGLTPDQVKARLTGTARPISTMGANLSGAGSVDSYAAATAPVVSTPQNFTLSTGLGSLQLDRGSVSVYVDTNAGPTPLAGEFVATTSPAVTDAISPLGLVPWTASNWTASNWTASNWTASNWTASNWTGVNWDASNWTASNWTASNWTASNWTNADWDASNWTASNWTASNWTASNWTASNWTASNWTSAWYAYAWD